MEELDGWFDDSEVVFDMIIFFIMGEQELVLIDFGIYSFDMILGFLSF